MSAQIEFSVKDNVLHIAPSNVDVRFQWPVAEVIDFDDVLVVRVEPDSGVCVNENVFGIDRDGGVIWAIEKRKHVYEDSPYTSITAEGGHVKLSNWDGDELLVEPKNGKVISVGYGR